MGDDLAAIYRREVGRCTATLIRVLGDMDLAEDAVAEAFAIAAERWPVTGTPPNPGTGPSTGSALRLSDPIAIWPPTDSTTTTWNAVAIAEIHGVDAGLAVLDTVDDELLVTYQPYQAARADLLARAGHPAEAIARRDRNWVA